MKSILTALITTALVIGSLFVIGRMAGQSSVSNLGGVNQRIELGLTNTSTTVNTTSTQVWAGSTGFQYLRLENDDVRDIYCYLDGKTAASSSVASTAGLRLAATTSTLGQTYFEIGADSPLYYTNTINCVAKGAAARLLLMYR